MATARSQPKPKPVAANPFGKFDRSERSMAKIFHLGLMINARQRPTLITATPPTALRPAPTAFATGLALPSGYTYESR